MADQAFERQVDGVLERAASVESEINQRIRVLERELAECRAAKHRLHAGVRRLFPSGDGRDA